MDRKIAAMGLGAVLVSACFYTPSGVEAVSEGATTDGVGSSSTDPMSSSSTVAATMTGDGTTTTTATATATTTSTTTGPEMPTTGATLESGDTSGGPSVCGNGLPEFGEGCDDGNNKDGDGCSAQCQTEGRGVCGDGVVNPGEECDDSFESGTCDADCTAAVCGDGTANLGAGEICDDGNMSNVDDCVACVYAKCGDGFVNPDFEVCDDGNQIDDDGCSNICQAESLRIFVGSGLYSANLGGLAGADMKCQALAEAAKLDGTWMAWLSDGSSGPAKRFVTKGGPKPYVRIDGKIVANNWADLIAKNLVTAIGITEKGQVPVITHAWTNTKADGTPAGPDTHCGNWLLSSGMMVGVNGDAAKSDPTWSMDGTDTCNTQNHLFCVEQ